MSVFSPEQEDQLRAMLAAAIEVAVACGVGDSRRMLTRLDFIRLSAVIGEHIERDRLVMLADQSMDEANASIGVLSNFSGRQR